MRGSFTETVMVRDFFLKIEMGAVLIVGFLRIPPRT
jgi:hypothetical protein